MVKHHTLVHFFLHTHEHICSLRCVPSLIYAYRDAGSLKDEKTHGKTYTGTLFLHKHGHILIIMMHTVINLCILGRW